MPLFWCTAFYYVNNLRIVYAKYLLYQSDKVYYQVKFHDHMHSNAFDMPKNKEQIINVLSSFLSSSL